jgi:hypothetical protein
LAVLKVIAGVAVTSVLLHLALVLVLLADVICPVWLLPLPGWRDKHLLLSKAAHFQLLIRLQRFQASLVSQRG